MNANFYPYTFKTTILVRFDVVPTWIVNDDAAPTAIDRSDGDTSSKPPRPCPSDILLGGTDPNNLHLYATISQLPSYAAGLLKQHGTLTAIGSVPDAADGRAQ